MYQIIDGQLVEKVPVGTLENVVDELTKLTLEISAITASLARAQHTYDNKVPELQNKIQLLVDEAKKLDMPEYLSEECIAKLQQFNII
jgi:hypothetical protein